ncbi:protein FAM193A-like isoform X2 [Patiria miniata]|uniref:FAM193 C-terminal domain-containing protein n=1 Tax=Patiria miniata TaxID=46514 RepID=A0A913Z0K1_PATMI|nr:protein FAM193A-like isoform X2 [Patiria miniata]
MSASDMKRSKRRRNKRGGGGGNAKPSRQQKQAGIGDQIITAAKTSATLSELNLDSIPQPLTQLPMRAINPYLQDHDYSQDREHCLLCRRERPDVPAHKVPPLTGDGKDTNQPNVTQVPLWLCPDCRRTVEEEERNATRNSQPPPLPQDFLLQPSFSPRLKLDGTLDLPASLLGTTAAKGSEATCSCERCRERREIAAEQEMVRQQLAESWSELSHVVRCVYWEAGTALAEDEDSSKLNLPHMKELLHRLCTHNPHQLFLQLELEVDDFLKEISGRLSRQLAAGYKSLAQVKQFVSMLLEEYDALCSAAKTLSGVLEQLEKEHLSKFQLTWLRHNMHMFHSTVYVPLGLREKSSHLMNELSQGTGTKEANLLRRYMKFDEDMTVIFVEWNACQQLIEKYHEEMSQDCLKTKQQMLSGDWEFLKTQKIFTDHFGLKTHSGNTGKDKTNSVKCHAARGVLGLLNENEAEHKGSTCKKKCPCDECSIARLTSSLLTPNFCEEISLKHLQEGANPDQLSALDKYLQNINPPDLSSTSSSSSEGSSEEDSDGVLQIFSRGDLTHSGFSSPRSEESDDSDDLDSNTSPSPTHNAAEEESGKRRVNGDGSSSDKEKSTRDGSLKDSTSNGRSSTCRACTASHMLSSSAFGTVNITDKVDLSAQPQSYLFYPNLANHQPLDLSHHGITAKHPFIHPHLYNPLTAQKTTKMATCQQLPTQQQQQQQTPFQLNVDTQEALRDHHGHTYGDWKSGPFESAKMTLSSRGYSSGHSTDPDLLQSVRAALHQSNCKTATERAPSLNTPASDQPCKQHAGKMQTDATSNKKRANHVCTEATTNGTVTATAATTTKEHSVQHHHHHHSNQSSTESSKKTRSDSGSDRCARHTLPAAKPPTTTSAVMQAYQQQCSQLGHTGVLTNGLHGGGGDAPPQGSKKKKADDDVILVDASLANDCGDDRSLQSCLYHGHPATAGVIDPQTGLCTSAMQTATSTPTSASVCSDPDCETHNCIMDEDMYGNCYDDRGSSNGNRERESKHCDCYYCEFFGHGGPQPAPTSRNYTENRDRLRLKLRDRQKRQSKDQSPSSADHNHEFDQFDHLDLSDDRTLDDLLSFINGEQQRQKSNAKTKAAKRNRQKQRKAEEKAKQEEEQEAMRQEELRRLMEEEQRKHEAAAAAAAAEEAARQEQQRQQQEREKAERQLQQKQQQQKTGKPEAPTLKNKKKGSKENQQQQGSKQQQQQQQKHNQSNGQSATSNQQKQSTNRQSPTKQVTQPQQATKQQQPAPAETPNSNSKSSTNKDKTKQQPQQASKQDSSTASSNQQEKNQKNQQHPTKPKQAAEQDSNHTNNHKQQNGKLNPKKVAENGNDNNHQLKKAPQAPAANINKTGSNKKQPQAQENHNKQKDTIKQKEDTKEKNHITSKTQPSHPSAKKAENQILVTKQEKIAVNGVANEPQTNGNIKKKKKKRNSSENPNASIDEIFMPKENADMADMDETEREIEDFKRFCMALTPAPKKEKVVFSMKELTLKKGTVPAH